MSREFVAIGLVTEDGKKLVLDYPDQFKQGYAQFAGDEVEVSVRKRRTKRSLRQNAAYHAAIAPFAEHCGYTTEELKLAMLGGCFGWHETGPLKGLPLRLHTSDLNTQGFSDLMAYTTQIAAEHDVLILDPSEWRAQRKKQLRRGTGNGESHARRSHGGGSAEVNSASASDSMERPA